MVKKIKEMPATQDSLIKSAYKGLALRPHLLNSKAKNTRFHRDVVCCALLVTGRLIFMFWLNKQLTTLSIVSCFALKTQLANTVDEQVES